MKPPVTKHEAEQAARLYDSLKGATVTAVHLERDTDGTSAMLFLRPPNGGPEFCLSALRDPEGNGPGTLSLYGIIGGSRHAALIAMVGGR